jgi:Cu-processing system permease protein
MKKQMDVSPVNIPAWYTVVPAIARVTWTEILRDKILYNVLMFAFILFCLGYLASRLTFIRPERVVLDFGMSAVSLSCTVMGVLFGAGIIGREFERRTVHVALSKPISRAQFVCGKFLGLIAVLTMNWALLCAVYVIILILMQGPAGTFSNMTFYPAIVFALLQSVYMAAMTIFFSTITTTTLSVVMSVGLFMIGENISTFYSVLERLPSGGIKSILRIIASVVPNLEYFQVGAKLTYALSLGWDRILYATLYGILITVVAVFAACLMIRRKEV